MPQIILGNSVFNTKKDANEYFRKILHGGQIGAPIPEPARAADFEHSSELFTDDHYRPRLANRALADDWRRFHHGLAHIRIVSAAANIAHNRDGLPNPKDRQLSFTDLL
jgi:hypothetical protein